MNRRLPFLMNWIKHRPNSRHVNHYRAQCLIALDQLEAAEALCSKLEGKLEADQWTALQQKLSKARTALADHTHRVESRGATASGDAAAKHACKWQYF